MISVLVSSQTVELVVLVSYDQRASYSVNEPAINRSVIWSVPGQWSQFFFQSTSHKSFSQLVSPRAVESATVPLKSKLRSSHETWIALREHHDQNSWAIPRISGKALLWLIRIQIFTYVTCRLLHIICFVKDILFTYFLQNICFQ